MFDLEVNDDFITWNGHKLNFVHVWRLENIRSLCKNRGGTPYSFESETNGNIVTNDLCTFFSVAFLIRKGKLICCLATDFLLHEFLYLRRRMLNQCQDMP